MSNHKTRVELAPADRFELWGRRVAVMTFQAARGEVDWDTDVTLRTQRAEYVGTVKVSQLAQAFNVADSRRLMRVGA